jgi:hypothetical protein
MSPKASRRKLLESIPLYLLASFPVVLVIASPELLGRWGTILGTLLAIVGLSEFTSHAVHLAIEPWLKARCVEIEKDTANFIWVYLFIAMAAINVGIFLANGHYQRQRRLRLTNELEPRISALLPKLNESVLPNDRVGFGLSPIGGSSQTGLAETSKMGAIRRPFIFVYLGRHSGGCSCSEFRDEALLANGQGVITASDFRIPRFLPAPADIKTLILIRDVGSENRTYQELTNGQPTGTTVLSRDSYEAWAFDTGSGALVAAGLLTDDYLQQGYNNTANDHLDYSDLRNWANELSH